VIDLRRDAIANVVINQLYKYTELQTSFGINNVALVKGRPRTLNLKELISEFVEFRHEVVVRRTKFELREAEKKAHILQGYLIALDHLDEVIALIRASATPEIAKDALVNAGWGLDEIQAKAILELRLQRLTGMEREKIKEEYDELMILIGSLKELLANEGMRFDVIKKELLEIKEKFADARKTEITYLDNEVRIKDLIKEEDVVITISHLGYIKRTPADEFRSQRRGGRGHHHHALVGQQPLLHPGDGAGVVAHRVRRDLGDLPPGQPLVSVSGQVAAQRGQHLTRLDDRVGPAEQAVGELAAQRRVHRADGRRVQQLELPPVRVGPRRRLFEQGQLGVRGGQRERARGPEADPGHLRAEFRPQRAGPQGQAELGSGLPAAHPDQAEVPHARAARLRLAFQLHDLEAAPPRRHRVHGAEHAAADDDHPSPCRHGI